MPLQMMSRVVLSASHVTCAESSNDLIWCASVFLFVTANMVLTSVSVTGDRGEDVVLAGCVRREPMSNTCVWKACGCGRNICKEREESASENQTINISVSYSISNECF